jgi:hypothetical protein
MTKEQRINDLNKSFEQEYKTYSKYLSRYKYEYLKQIHDNIVPYISDIDFKAAAIEFVQWDEAVKYTISIDKQWVLTIRNFLIADDDEIKVTLFKNREIQYSDTYKNVEFGIKFMVNYIWQDENIQTKHVLFEKNQNHSDDKRKVSGRFSLIGNEVQVQSKSFISKLKHFFKKYV